MPKASDGKYFPYTKDGIAKYKKYEASLKRNNQTMGKDRTESPYNKLRSDNAPNTQRLV